MDNEFVISAEEVQTCLKFAKDFTIPSENKSGLDFGNNKLPRDLIDKIADCTLGKIGELAFKKFCVQHGLEIEIDFEVVTGRHEIDFGQDISSVVIDGFELAPLAHVDIKTTKANGQWLLLETHKHWATIVVLITADLPSNIEQDLTAFNTDINCKFIGFAYLSDFYDSKGKPWFEYQQNARLMSSDAINFMYNKAKSKYKTVTLKSQMTEFYKEMCIGIPEQHIGPKLKCPVQVGLPKRFLRNSVEDIQVLIEFIKNTSVPNSLISLDLAKALISWNVHLTKLNRSLTIK